MTGEHGYRRMDARKALARGLEGKLPASWKHAEENATVEVWLTINGATAVCGLRLSDRSMRHRTYKEEHLPASLRPTVAAAMVRLAGIRPHQVYCDPMCGAGTILGELLAVLGGSIGRTVTVAGRRRGPRRGEGGGAEPAPARPGSPRPLGRDPPAARRRLRGLHPVEPAVRQTDWRRRRRSCRSIAAWCRAYDRVLKPGGRAVLLVSEVDVLKDAIKKAGWKSERLVHARVLGQNAVISSWKKPSA